MTSRFSSSLSPHRTRRDVLQRGLLAAGSLCAGVLPAAGARANPVGANGQIRVGVIGTGVRGKYLIGNLPEIARVTAICDCATTQMASVLEPKGAFASVLQKFKDRDAAHCATHQDYRRMFDREQLDAVIIATPDHHHSLAALLALRAGLDVYLEKPLTVCVREGRLLADQWKGGGHVARPHLQNWLDAIRAGAKLNAPVEAGHRTATVCHLANIARELNRPLRWNPATEQFMSDDAANQLLDRPRRRGFELPNVIREVTPTSGAS